MSEVGISVPRYHEAMEDSAARRVGRPRRVDEDERDRELAAIVANVPGAIYRCALDPDWSMAVISDEIERISGYPAADFVGSARRTFGSIIHPDDRAEVDRAVRPATSADRPFALEYRVVRADGRTAWALERGRQVAGPGGACLHGVIFDVTSAGSCGRNGRGSSPRRTRRAARSGATCTTAPSSGS